VVGAVGVGAASFVIWIRALLATGVRMDDVLGDPSLDVVSVSTGPREAHVMSPNVRSWQDITRGLRS
jgi:hypothetical protein